MKRKATAVGCVSKHGFTLIEVLVSMAIISILLVALTAVFERSSKLYTTQNAVAALQQDVRTAMDIIVSEIRMAGFKPKQEGFDVSKRNDFGIKKSDVTHIRFKSDLNEDGVGEKDYNTDGDCENRSFSFSALAKGIYITCGEGTTSAPDREFLLGGYDSDLEVTALDFDYRDKEDNSTSINSAIRSVIVSIIAQAPAGRDGMVSRTYTTRVEIRNAGKSMN